MKKPVGVLVVDPELIVVVRGGVNRLNADGTYTFHPWPKQIEKREVAQLTSHFAPPQRDEHMRRLTVLSANP